jgi:hypothetical protein
MEALKIKPDWSKGYFRKAKALAGLEVCNYICHYQMMRFAF